jgi:hypothetical protein
VQRLSAYDFLSLAREVREFTEAFPGQLLKLPLALTPNIRLRRHQRHFLSQGTSQF